MTCIAGDVFAKLVGQYPDQDIVLFKVSGQFLADAGSNEWSGPVMFRFVRREGALVELELHKLDPTGEPWTEAQRKGLA